MKLYNIINNVKKQFVVIKYNFVTTVHKISGYKIFEKEVVVRPGYLNNSVTEKWHNDIIN